MADLLSTASISDKRMLIVRSRNSASTSGTSIATIGAWVRGIIGLALFAPIASGSAQRIPDSIAARAVGASFLNAMQAGDWTAAQAFLDHAALERFRQWAVAQAKSRSTISSVTVEGLMMADTALPRAVAEYYVKRSKNIGRGQSFVEQEFGIANPDSVARLPIDTVGARWLELHDERWLTRRAIRESNCPHPVDSVARPPATHQLGIIVADSVAYLLYEFDVSELFRAEAVYSRSPHVMLLRRDRDGWWVLPRSDLFSTMGIMISCEVRPK